MIETVKEECDRRFFDCVNAIVEDYYKNLPVQDVGTGCCSDLNLACDICHVPFNLTDEHLHRCTRQEVEFQVQEYAGT